MWQQSGGSRAFKPSIKGVCLTFGERGGLTRPNLFSGVPHQELEPQSARSTRRRKSLRPLKLAGLRTALLLNFNTKMLKDGLRRFVL